MLELKKDKGTEYIISCKSKGVYNSKLIALHRAYLPKVKYFRNKTGIQFNSTPLVIEHNNHARKIFNIYIVYDLDNWPKNSLRNFALKNYFFGSTNIAKDNDKEQYVYSSYGITFDRKCPWSFNDDFARNIIIFGVDNSSSSHTDNLENFFLFLSERDTLGIKESFGAPERKLALILVKQRQNFA